MVQTFENSILYAYFLKFSIMTQNAYAERFMLSVINAQCRIKAYFAECHCVLGRYAAYFLKFNKMTECLCEEFHAKCRKR